MTIQGRIEKGTVVLDNDVTLPDGTLIEVRVVETRQTPVTGSDQPCLYDQLSHLVGVAETGLPDDFAAQHDHYIHGTTKR